MPPWWVWEVYTTLYMYPPYLPWVYTVHTVLPVPTPACAHAEAKSAWAQKERNPWVEASARLKVLNPVRVGTPLRVESSALPENKC